MKNILVMSVCKLHTVLQVLTGKLCLVEADNRFWAA